MVTAAARTMLPIGGRKQKRRSWVRRTLGPMAQDSLRASILTLMSAAIGPGALLLPFSFRLVGMPCGIVLVLLGMYCTAQSLRLLLTISHATGTNSYSAGVAAVLGPASGKALAVLMVAVTLCALSAHLMFLVDLTKSMLPDLALSRGCLAALWAMNVSPACFARDLTSVRNFAPIGPLGLVIVSLLVLGRAWSAFTMSGVAVASEEEHQTMFFGDGGLWGVPRAWSIIVNALTVHHIAVPVLRFMRNAEGTRINKAVERTVVAMGVLYGAIAICGFYAFGSSTPENVLRAWPRSDFRACVGRAMVAGSLMVSIPLCVNAGRAQVIELLPARAAARAGHPGSSGYVLATTLMLAVPAFVGTIFPSVTSIVNIACGFGMVMYMYVVPAVAVCALRWQGGRGLSGSGSGGVGEFTNRMLSSPLSSPLLSPKGSLVSGKMSPRYRGSPDRSPRPAMKVPDDAVDMTLEFETPGTWGDAWDGKSDKTSSTRASTELAAQDMAEADEDFEMELEWSPWFALVLALLSLGTVMGFAAAGWAAVRMVTG